MNVLVVEDNKVIAMAMRRLFANSGHEAEISLSAEDALKIVDGQQFDLVVVDWILPRKSGLSLVRSLRKMEAYRQTPIIMATGKNSTENVVEALEAGANDYIVKPVSHSVLMRKVSNVMNAA